LALSILDIGSTFTPERSAKQREGPYLVTAYPPVFKELIMKYSAEYSVRPELLYSLMRRESLLYAAALSDYGALGLFQFFPKTFAELDSKWDLLNKSRARA